MEKDNWGGHFASSFHPICQRAREWDEKKPTKPRIARWGGHWHVFYRHHPDDKLRWARECGWRYYATPYFHKAVEFARVSWNATKTLEKK